MKRSANKYSLFELYDVDEQNELSDLKKIEVVEEFLNKNAIPTENDKMKWDIDMVAYYNKKKELLVVKGELVEEEDILEVNGIARTMQGNVVKGMEDEALGERVVEEEDVLEVNGIARTMQGNVVKGMEDGALGEESVLVKLETRSNVKFYGAFIYAANGGIERKELWKDLEIYRSIVGIDSCDMKDFQCCVNNIKVEDINSFGLFYTWTKNLHKNKLSEEDDMAMIRKDTDDEIKQAMFKIDDNKAPRPYGFSAHFFKKAWSTVGKDVCEAVKESSVKTLKESNKEFGNVVGLLPNYNKSTIIFGILNNKEKKKMLEIKEAQKEDSEIWTIVENLYEQTEFRLDEDDVLWQGTRLCVPNDATPREALLTEAHSSPFSVHPGSTKMYHDLKQHFWWSGMKRDVATFVSRCLICLQVKIEHQRASGLLQPLDIHVWKWDEKSMDFVTGLPQTQRRHDAIWVVEDRLTKSAHFLPIRKDYSVSKLAETFQQEIVRLHGTPSAIVSDRDPHFAKCHAPICWDQVGERVIKGPEMIEVTNEKVTVAKEKLKEARTRKKSYADKHRRSIEFQPGDRVFLKVSPARRVRRFGIKGKLSTRFIGPFEILDRVGEVSYRLALPPQLSHVHNVLGFYDTSKSGNLTPISDPIIALSSPSLTSFVGGDFILEKIEAYLTSKSITPRIDDTNLDLEEDIRLLEELLNNDPSSSPLPPKELNVEEVK
nr:retrotransposon protein, putative, Ty3-gypsy subclass [Tanacetum cinerariifolium]